jgi:hypothetical protein
VYVPAINPIVAIVLFAKVTVPDTSTLLPPSAEAGASINLAAGDKANDWLKVVEVAY